MQSGFDELWRKLVTYSAGEELFGLPLSDYDNLQRIRKELTLLQKLYGLYNAVMRSIDGYFDILWVEVDIEKINAEIIEFQNRWVDSGNYNKTCTYVLLSTYLFFHRCRKLPKALKEWQAFQDLSKKIDDFNETCPLLELMANPSMKERHWERIANVTGHKFDIDDENFLLKNVMEAPLLPHKEDIEV